MTQTYWVIKEVGYRYLRSGGTQGIYYVDIVPGSSVGRVITATIRALKEVKYNAVVFFGVSGTTFAGNLKPLITRYKARANGGTLFRGGPKYPRQVPGFFRRVARGMIKYKTRAGSRVYKSLIVEPDEKTSQKVRRLGVPLTLRLKTLRYHPRVSISRVVSQL